MIVGARLHLFALPAPSQRAVLDRLLADLANRYGGPHFLPHMTLYAGDFERAADLVGLARELAATTDSFSLSVKGIAGGPKIYKSVYLDLEPAPVVTRLTERAREIAVSKDYTFAPHVSLLYQELAAGASAEIASGMNCPFTHLRFSEVLVNRRPLDARRPVDVAAWRTLLRLPLRGGSR